MDLVQFSLCQKWTGPVFALPKVDRSSFCSAKSGPGPVFTSPMVDPVQFSLSPKWTCLVFVQPKVGSTYRSLFQILILSYVFIILLNSWQRSTCQCCLSLTTLVTCPCQYIHTGIHMQWLFAYRCRLLYVCCGNVALVSTLMLQDFLMVLIKTLNKK